MPEHGVGKLCHDRPRFVLVKSNWPSELTAPPPVGYGGGTMFSATNAIPRGARSITTKGVAPAATDSVKCGCGEATDQLSESAGETMRRGTQPTVSSAPHPRTAQVSFSYGSSARIG